MGLIRLKVILLHQPYCYGSLPLAAGSCREYVQQCPIYFYISTDGILRFQMIEKENIDRAWQCSSVYLKASGVDFSHLHARTHTHI